ncbi:hypothetical protein [Rhodopirellula bahusiensis]|uniref:hypothetical protein n=1 Tax=Rhodopirellula bahusiensis TaxID=2014065 RepID=UPI003264CF24
MANLVFHDVDPNHFADSIASQVADSVRQELANLAEPRLVDRAKMAELIGISVPKLDELTREKQIPSISIGARRVFDPADVFASLKQEGGGQ